MLENLTQIAVGLANGTVILIRGDLQKERTTKQKVIHEGSEPITGKQLGLFRRQTIYVVRNSNKGIQGLGFREQTKSIILFMVTTSSVMTYNTTATKPSTVSKICIVLSRPDNHYI